MPKIYRFLLTDLADSTNIKIETALKQDKEVLRSAIDSYSQKKSISILVKDTADDSIKNDLAEKFTGLGITCQSINQPIETIDDEATTEKPVEDEKTTLIDHPHKHNHDCEHQCDHGHHHDHHHWWQGHWWKGMVGILWGIALLMLSILSLNIPIIAVYSITAATALMTLYLGRQIYIAAITELFRSKDKKLSMNTLYMLSTVTILIVSIVSFFFPWLPVMFEAAPLILGLWHIGEAIEHKLKEKIGQHLNIIDYAPKKITRIDHNGHKIENFNAQHLIPNDIIEIPAGQTLPVNGICLSDATLSTQRVDGSPAPRKFQSGDPVSAGMCLTNGSGNLTIRVTRTFKNSYLSRVQENTNQASIKKAPIEIFTQQILKYFIPALLSMAIISSILVGIFFTPALGIQCGIAVLVSACPCALKFVISTVVLVGKSKAAEQGIHFKSGETLQAAANIDKVVFDLNRTLTTGKPEVDSVEILDEKTSADTFWQYVKSLESGVEHGTAEAIYNYATKQPTETSALTISNIDRSNNSGIKATINGVRFIIGNATMLRDTDKGIKIPESKNISTLGCPIYLVRDSVVIGVISVVDPLRKDAKPTVKQLQDAGKQVYICTGTDQETAHRYATQLNIPAKNVAVDRAGASDDDDEQNSTADDKNLTKRKLTKADFIEQQQERGRYKVAMIGDTLNDLTAITGCDFGVAIRLDSGDGLIEQHADATVPNQSLMSIVSAFDIAKKTKRNISQNLTISLTYNTIITFVAAGALLAIAFSLNPIIGIMLMVLETTLVLGNTALFKAQALPDYHQPALPSTYEKLTCCWPSTKIQDSPSTASRKISVDTQLFKRKVDPDSEESPESENYKQKTYTSMVGQK